MANNEARALRVAERERRQLSRLEKEKAKPKPKLYLWYMLLILALIYIVDEVATNLPNALETEINLNLFVMPWAVNQGYDYTTVYQALSTGSGPEAILNTIKSGLSKISLIQTIANATLVLSMFYKPLADKFGRKPFLFFNTLGMGAALLIIFTAPNLFVFALGYFCLRFFVTPDQQVIYIFEIAPEKQRGVVYSLTKGVAELGLVFISLLRRVFIKDASIYDSYKWIFLTIAVAASVIAFLALFFSRESDIFLDERIAYLKQTPAEREAIRASKEASKAEGGFLAGLRLVFKDRQLRWICIIIAILELGYASCNKYSVILSNAGFAWNGLSSSDVTEAQAFFPYTCALVTCLYGFVSDKWGRKIVSVTLLSLAAAFFILEFVGLANQWPAWLIGLFLGCVLGADWSMGDVFCMMAGESAPTNLRASVLTAYSLFFGFGMIASQGLSALLPKLIPLNYISLSFFFIAVIPWTVGLILLMIKVKETKGVSLDRGDRAAKEAE